MTSEWGEELSQEKPLNIIESITPEEINDTSRSQIIEYLQYVSITFSILFSMAWIYYFLNGNFWNNNPENNENTIIKKPIVQTENIHHDLSSGSFLLIATGAAAGGMYDLGFFQELDSWEIYSRTYLYSPWDILSTKGGITRSLITTPGFHQGIAIDSSGNIYDAFSSSNFVYKYDSLGNVIDRITVIGYPTKMVVDAKDNIFINLIGADSSGIPEWSGSIGKISPLGVYSVFAYYGEGTYGTDITVNEDGSLFGITSSGEIYSVATNSSSSLYWNISPYLTWDYLITSRAGSVYVSLLGSNTVHKYIPSVGLVPYSVLPYPISELSANHQRPGITALTNNGNIYRITDTNKD